MRVITATNINEAFSDGIQWLRVAGIPETSRNGNVLVSPDPVVTVYHKPQERVLFNAKRDANAVFHLMEALWMIAGQSDLKFLLPFNARMQEYADKGTIQWGAYGRRWRTYFGRDQLAGIVKELDKNPNSRRAVLGMWDPMLDGTHEGPDIPCNTHIYFDLRNQVLNMTVCCRSNDALWGAYGANVVHFSILQEVLAGELGVRMGVYRQFSNNFHIYTDLPMVQDFLVAPPEVDDKYAWSGVVPVSIMDGASLSSITEDCRELVRGEHNFKTQFMRNVAAPLRNAYLARKEGLAYSAPTGNIDWFVAFREWLERRAVKND